MNKFNLKTLLQLSWDCGNDQTDFEEKEFDGFVDRGTERKWREETQKSVLKDVPVATGWMYRMSIYSDDYPDGRLSLSCSCPGCGIDEIEWVGNDYEQEYYRCEEEIADGTIKYFDE